MGDTPGVRIAATKANGEAKYYLTDQVDSVSLVADDESHVETRTEYMPFGETWFQEGDSVNKPKYNSQELDAETGLYFYNARYYDGETGRFVTADNIVPYEDDTQSWNRYGYCRNNPISYKDPTGHEDTGVSDMALVGQMMYMMSPFKKAVDDIAKMKERKDKADAKLYSKLGITPVGGEKKKSSKIDEVCAKFKNNLDCLGDEALSRFEKDPNPGLALIGLASKAAAILAPSNGDELAMMALPIPKGASGAAAKSTGLSGKVSNGRLASQGGYVRRFEQEADKTYFRVFSGDKTQGSWLTSERPKSSAWAQEALSLPPDNKAEFIQEVLVPKGTKLERSRASAVPAWNRNRGGGEQFELLERIPSKNFGPGVPLK